MGLVKEFDLHILEQKFDDLCTLTGVYRLRYEAPLHEKIALLNATGHNLSVEG
jgi:hypothetical protein